MLLQCVIKTLYEAVWELIAVYKNPPVTREVKVTSIAEESLIQLVQVLSCGLFSMLGCSHPRLFVKAKWFGHTNPVCLLTGAVEARFGFLARSAQFSKARISLLGETEHDYSMES